MWGSSGKEAYVDAVLEAFVVLVKEDMPLKEFAGAVGSGAIKSVGTMFSLLGDKGVSVEDRLEMLDAMALDIRNNIEKDL